MKHVRTQVRIKLLFDNSVPTMSNLVQRWTTTHGHLLQMGGFRLRVTTFENFAFRYFVSPDETYFVTIRVREMPLIFDEFLYLPRNPLEVADTFFDQMEMLVFSAGSEFVPEEDAAQVDFGDDIWEGVLTLDAFRQLLAENLICFPTITKDEINDKSKGDALSKAIALLQLTWFIVQIITRAAQGLAISELELTTAALAGLNSVMYIFWWSKPRDIRFPLIIQTKGTEELLVKGFEEVNWDFASSDPVFQEESRSRISSVIKENIKKGHEMRKEQAAILLSSSKRKSSTEVRRSKCFIVLPSLMMETLVTNQYSEIRNNISFGLSVQHPWLFIQAIP